MKRIIIIIIFVLLGIFTLIYFTSDKASEARYDIDASGKVIGIEQTYFYHSVITPFLRKTNISPDGQLRIYSNPKEIVLPIVLKSQIDSFMNLQGDSEFVSGSGVNSRNEYRDDYYIFLKYGHPINFVKSWRLENGKLVTKEERMGPNGWE
jgi:hypothetical protein